MHGLGHGLLEMADAFAEAHIPIRPDEKVYVVRHQDVRTDGGDVVVELESSAVEKSCVDSGVCEELASMVCRERHEVDRLMVGLENLPESIRPIGNVGHSFSCFNFPHRDILNLTTLFFL